MRLLQQSSFLTNSTMDRHCHYVNATILNDSALYATVVTNHWEDPISLHSTKSSIPTISHAVFALRLLVLMIPIMSMTAKFIVIFIIRLNSPWVALDVKWLFSSNTSRLIARILQSIGIQNAIWYTRQVVRCIRVDTRVISEPRRLKYYSLWNITYPSTFE